MERVRSSWEREREGGAAAPTKCSLSRASETERSSPPVSKAKAKVRVAPLPQRSFNVDSAFPLERPEEARTAAGATSKAAAAAEVRVWLGRVGAASGRSSCTARECVSAYGVTAARTYASRARPRRM